MHALLVSILKLIIHRIKETFLFTADKTCTVRRRKLVYSWSSSKFNFCVKQFLNNLFNVKGTRKESDSQSKDILHTSVVSLTAHRENIYNGQLVQVYNPNVIFVHANYFCDKGL